MGFALLVDEVPTDFRGSIHAIFSEADYAK